MTKYEREYPLFSLCGLNCGLCPRYQTKSESKCCGCGGHDFHFKHPACAVITCNRKNDKVEYCFQCSLFPCKRYRSPSSRDSFISYYNVIADLEKASKYGVEQYIIELNEKVNILEFLINNYDDGRRKNFYCIAVNLLELQDLRDIITEIKQCTNGKNIDFKENIKKIIQLFETTASKKNIIIKLRK